jgi:hypothetical protein
MFLCFVPVLHKSFQKFEKRKWKASFLKFGEKTLIKNVMEGEMESSCTSQCRAVRELQSR